MFVCGGSITALYASGRGDAIRGSAGRRRGASTGPQQRKKSENPASIVLKNGSFVTENMSQAREFHMAGGLEP